MTPGSTPIAGHTLLDTEQLAEELGLRPQTLREWRQVGDGPAFVKVGARVRYRRVDVDAWITARIRRSTSDPGPQPVRDRRAS